MICVRVHDVCTPLTLSIIIIIIIVIERHWSRAIDVAVHSDLLSDADDDDDNDEAAAAVTSPAAVAGAQHVAACLSLRLLRAVSAIAWRHRSQHLNDSVHIYIYVYIYIYIYIYIYWKITATPKRKSKDLDCRRLHALERIGKARRSCWKLWGHPRVWPLLILNWWAWQLEDVAYTAMSEQPERLTDVNVLLTTFTVT